MTMWIVIVTMSLIWIGLWCFTAFSLWKQYRYATMFTDMLPFYTPFSILALLCYAISVILWVPFPFWIVVLIPGIVVCMILVYYSNRWARSYRLRQYLQILRELSSQTYAVKLFREYEQGNLELDKVNVFIRHDIDISLSRLKRMIELEIKAGLLSTCFFRFHAERYNMHEAVPIIKHLLDKGFEIGYHYEVFSYSKGDKNKAKVLFTEELQILREVAPVSAVCGHGTSGFSNREVWPSIDQNALQVWSAYDMKYDTYITDAGGKYMIGLHGFDIVDLLRKAKPGDIVQVLIHPDWWF